MKAVIFGGAEIIDYGFCEEYIKGSMVVCCDSGMRHAFKLGIIPNVIVGDFDSADISIINYFKSKNIPFSEYPTHKDETDIELGLDEAIKMGATDITIIGGIGSRMDHTMANCHLLLYLLKNGINARMVNENNEIQVIEKKAQISGKKGDLISLIPLSMKVMGITTKGLEYPLYNAVLTIDDRLIAVSNVMLDTVAEVTIEEGYLFVMRCRD
ncbi:MAG: thiamine diphosphokinase [Lachnospiraceae bacterium]|nr:thiamine diphosphokinase [Lachnospiraceae bacterium]